MCRVTKRWVWPTLLSVKVLLLLALTGCQAFGGNDAVATIESDLTMYAAESDALRGAATAEREMAAATLKAAGTAVAELSIVNAALAATLRTNFTPTPEIRPVVVSAEDMGSSLDQDMMDDEVEVGAEMQVSNLATAVSVDSNSGCSSGEVRQFSADAQRIYVTARVTSLVTGSRFSVDWQYEDRVVYRVSWQADYSKSFECIWFYATPTDFSFLPGSYTATLFVDGSARGTTTFTIASA